MSTVNKKNIARSHYATKSALSWYLEIGYHLCTLTEAQARHLSAVNRTTFDRWQRGESSAPTATLQLIRMHALGEPPGGWSNDWDGFRFQNGLLVTPHGELSPGDLQTFHFYKRTAHAYMSADQHAPRMSA
jgi:hypothetical protein